MSLLREVSADFGQLSNEVVANTMELTTLSTGALGYGVQVVPAPQAAGSTVPFLKDTTAMITLSNQNFNIQFSAADCFVGRIITGINKGQGVATFIEAVPGTITFVDNGGFSVVPSTSPVPVTAYPGAFATFVCTEANGTTAVLQTTMGHYGGNPVLTIPAATTSAIINTSTETVISQTSAPCTLAIVPLYLQGDGLPGLLLSFTQVGGTTGSLTLVAAPGTTLTLLSLASGLPFNPVIAPGSTFNFVVVSGTLSSVVLQQV
jgi:hypothetical protein